MKIKWKCLKCNNVKTSDSSEGDHMDFCECGESAMNVVGGCSRGIIEIL